MSSLSVSGSGYSASITGASGSLNSATFSITGGTATLMSPTSSFTDVIKEVHGSLFGDNAQALGGNWGIKGNRLNAAVGVFQGPIATSSIPIPAPIILLASGLLGLAGIGRKKLFKK